MWGRRSLRKLISIDVRVTSQRTRHFHWCESDITTNTTPMQTDWATWPPPPRLSPHTSSSCSLPGGGGGGGVTTSANSTRIFMCNFVTSEFNLSRVSRLWFGFERRRLFSVFLINFIREILNINWVIRLFRINDGNILLWYVNLLGLGRGTLGPQLEKWIRLLHTFEHGMHYYSRVRVWFIIVLEKLKDFSNVPMLVPVIVSMVTILLTYHEWKRHINAFTLKECIMGNIIYHLPLHCFSWPWLEESWSRWFWVKTNFPTLPLSVSQLNSVSRKIMIFLPTEKSKRNEKRKKMNKVKYFCWRPPWRFSVEILADIIVQLKEESETNIWVSWTFSSLQSLQSNDSFLSRIYLTLCLCLCPDLIKQLIQLSKMW